LSLISNEEEEDSDKENSPFEERVNEMIQHNLRLHRADREPLKDITSEILHHESVQNNNHNYMNRFLD